MNVFKQYVEYLQDNPEKYWFKRKLYGWGWTPARWQGWIVTFVFVALILTFAFTVDEGSSANEFMFTFFLPIVLLTITFIRIAYKTGEKPKWQWGFPKRKK